MRLFHITIRGLACLAPLIATVACGNEAAFARDAKSDTAVAITNDSAARARQDSVNRAQPGYVIDSLLPVDEEMRRFRAAIGGAPATVFTGGSDSRDELVARFVRAVEGRDTLDLLRMTLTAREFIDLYYPESPHTRAPYRQSPGLLWGQIELTSAKGVTRLLDRRGGLPLGAAGLHCPVARQQEGRNTLWGKCELLTRDGNGPARRERLFGAIIAREGKYKFFSLANGY